MIVGHNSPECGKQIADEAGRFGCESCYRIFAAVSERAEICFSHRCCGACDLFELGPTVSGTEEVRNITFRWKVGKIDNLYLDGRVKARLGYRESMRLACLVVIGQEHDGFHSSRVQLLCVFGAPFVSACGVGRGG